MKLIPRSFGSIITFALVTVPSVAFAAPPTPGVDPCGRIGGCSTNGQELIGILIQNTASVFVSVAAGLSVLFIVVGGFQLILGFGNDGMITKGKHSVYYALGGFALALSSQAIVSFVLNSAYAGGLATAVDNPALAVMRVMVDTMLNVFNAVFVAIIVIAGTRMVINHGKQEDITSSRSTLKHAVIGAALVNIARALVHIILTAGF